MITIYKSLRISALLVFLWLGTFAFADGRLFMYDKMRFEILTDSTCRFIKSYRPFSTLPEKAKLGRKQYTVTSIGQYSFRGNRKIQYFKTPPSIKEICAYAFYDTGIVLLEFSEEVEYIHDFAVAANSRLKQVIIRGKDTQMSTLMFFLNPIEYVDYYSSVLYTDKSFETMLAINGIPYPSRLKKIHLRCDGVASITEDIMDKEMLRTDVAAHCEIPTYDALGYGCFWRRDVSDLHIYVPMSLLEEYKMHDIWGQYKYLLGE